MDASKSSKPCVDAHGAVRILVTFRNRGEAVQNLELFSRAWDECVELQQSPKQEWIGRSLLSLQQLDRYEIAAVQGSDVVGAVLLAEDKWDVHVGPCVSVFSQYVLPEYRERGISSKLMREAIKLARAIGVSTLAFTHRKAPWVYTTRYWRIK